MGPVDSGVSNVWVARWQRDGTYQDVGILAHAAVGVCLDNALHCPARVKLLSRCHGAGRKSSGAMSNDRGDERLFTVGSACYVIHSIEL